MWIWVDGDCRFEHRVVMEQKLGRALSPDEVVHHVNGVKHDNRPENLQLFSSPAAHTRYHAEKDESDQLN